MLPESVTLWDVVKWLASALGAVALWLVRVFTVRIDKYEADQVQLNQKLRELERNTVSRPTFQRHEADLKDTLSKMRDEAVGREDRTIAAINRLESRIDKVLESRRD